jgi:chromosome segregation ATPase
MVMSFFRRSEEPVKPGLRVSSHRQTLSVTEQTALVDKPPVQYNVSEVDDFQAFGTAIEENKQSSEELLVSLTSLQERVSSLLGAHSQSLNETGALRAECSRLGSLLDYESNARRKADQENQRLTVENKELKLDNSQLRVEAGTYREELVKLQGVHELTREEFTVVEARLIDAEREIRERALQFDEVSSQLRRTQQDHDARGRELASTREKLELETTAHQLLVESSRRENSIQLREIARLNEERSHLKTSLSEHEALTRSLQSSVSNLKQDLVASEERYRRLEAEFETLETSSTLEIANLRTKQEAIASKSELVEKLLSTANSRNKMTDEELQSTRTELKRTKGELATALARLERMTDELNRVRLNGTESEAARRELAAHSNDLVMKLREAESQRSKRDREIEAFKNDLDTRLDTDRYEISQLRTSLEIAKSEIRQLRAERAILNGQLEVARGERPSVTETALPEEEPLKEEVRMPAATFAPMIDISSKSLRGNGMVAGSVNDELAVIEANLRTPPAE